MGYLSSLGKTHTAALHEDTDIGVAEAERDAGIRVRKLQLVINTKKAEAQLAYELQAAEEQQNICLREIEIEVVQRKKPITIEEEEIEEVVKRPAEAEAYKMQQLAEGQKCHRCRR